MEYRLSDVMTSLRSAGVLAADGHLEQALAEATDIWQQLPSDKVEIPNAYMIVEYAVAILLRLGRVDDARIWAERGLDFREKRHDLGEAEFLIAKVAYEQGRLHEARELLVAAISKSNGRILRGEDPKYRALLQSLVEG